MVYKIKVTKNLPEERLRFTLEEKIGEVLKENPNFSFVGSSVVKEGEDELTGVETLLVMFEDPD